MRSESLESKAQSKNSLKSTILAFIRQKTGSSRLHFVHIGKTGGTAIRNTLQDLQLNERTKIHFHSHNVTLKDIPKGDQIFFVIRNPVSRFISAFYSRQRQGQPAYFRSWSEGERVAFERFQSPDALASSLYCEDEKVRALAEEAMHSIEHVEDYYWDWFGDEDYLSSRLEDVFFVGCLENLDHDFATLKTRLGLPADLQLPSDSAKAHRRTGCAEPVLKQLSVNNLQAWYSQDFAFIQYLVNSITDTSVFPSRKEVY